MASWPNPSAFANRSLCERRGVEGAVFFGYFLLGKQKKVTGRQDGGRNTQGRESVLAKCRRATQSKWIPASAGMTASSWIPAFVGMTSKHHPHPTLPLKGRAKAKTDSGFRRNDSER